MKPGPKPAPLEALWARVDRSAGPLACWPWTGYLRSDGYGEITCGGRKWRAHCLAYALVKGAIPDGQLVRHECDNRRCCNPGHLLTGTLADNMRDMVERGRSARGERNGQSRFTDAQRREICRRARAGETQAQLAREFHVSRASICRIVNGRTFRLTPTDRPTHTPQGVLNAP